MCEEKEAQVTHIWPVHTSLRGDRKHMGSDRTIPITASHMWTAQAQEGKAMEVEPEGV